MQTKHIGRRELLRTGGMGAVALSLAAIPQGTAEPVLKTEELVRAFARKLLTERDGLIVAEWRAETHRRNSTIDDRR